MTAPVEDGGERSPASRLVSGLPALIDALRGADFDVGNEQYLAACDLLLAHAAEDRAIGSAELCAMLGGLFCTSADEQQRFAEHFDRWYGPIVAEGLAPPPPPPPPPPIEPSWPGAVGARWTAVVAVIFAIAITAGLMSLEHQTTDTGNGGGAGGPGNGGPGSPIATSTAPQPTDTPDPRQPAEPVIAAAEYDPARAYWLRLLWVPVFLVWAAYFLQRLMLRLVVLSRRRRRTGEEFTLRHLSLAAERRTGFGTAALADTWRHLRQFREMPSRRLDEAATIDRTLGSGGFFQPVYRERQVPPAYLMMVDRRHGEDHAAAIADELAGAMRRENIVVSTVYFNENPRYIAAEGSVAADQNPAALAGVHADRGLMLVGSTDALFDAETNEPHPWLEEFGSWERKVMLTQDPLWPDGERLKKLGDRGFDLLPLTSEGLGQIDAGGSIGEDDPRDLPLPRRFSFSTGRWLEEGKPPRKVLAAALADLRRYLGPDGSMLLVACAAYPALYADLTRALDAQLRLPLKDRGMRLRKISRLPWFRHGRMPDYLRRALLRMLRREDCRRITGAYHALLDNRDQRDLRLPVAVPEWKGVQAWLRELSSTGRQPDPLADRVFANVLRGRRPRLTEFALPPGFARPLAGQRWRGLVLPLVAGLFVVPAALWLNVWASQAWFGPGVELGPLAAIQGEAHSDIAADEAVVFFRTSAWQDEGGQAWRVPIHGWIYEPQDSTARKSLFTRALDSQFGLAPDERTDANFTRRLNLLIADNERGKKIVISLAGRTYVLPESAANGHFETVLIVPTADIDADAVDSVLTYSAVTAENEIRRFSGEVLLVDPEGMSIISDIDDTVKITNVTDRTSLLEHTFLLDFSAVPDMAARYRDWSADGASLHFVSSSPWQLYSPLKEFFDASGFPPATLTLKSVRFRDETLFDLFETGTETKSEAIEVILNRYPNRIFVLIGDSGEQDPEVYAALMLRHPDQILKILIRNVTGASADDERFASVFGEIEPDRWQLFDDPLTLNLPENGYR